MASPEATSASPAAAAADLGPGGEEEWARLRTLLDLDRGRWLGFLFTGSPLADQVLRGRTNHVLCRTTAERVEVIEPASPDELRAVLEGLFQPWPAGVGCRWISAVRIDPGAGPGDWAAAWEHLLLRLNDRRDALLRATPRGVMFSAAEEVKRVARDGAPDLWAMRNMVLEIPSGTGIAGATPVSVGSLPPPDAGPSTTASPPRAATDRLTPAVRDALRDVARQLSLGAEDKAVARAHDAVRLAASESDRALARAWLSRAQEAEGDTTQAVQSATAALWFGTDMDDELAERVLRLGPVLGRESDAVGALERHVARLRAPGSDPARLRVALDQLGTIRFNLGVMEAAAGDFAQALTLNRAGLNRNPVSATGRRNLSVSLNKVGDTDLALGDTVAARAHYQDALALARRLLDLYGDTPQALRDL
jgi:tetratricopeptide (TPR) repeat protein